MRLAILLAMLAGLSVAIQISLTAAAQRVLRLTVLVAISGLTTGILASTASLVVGKPEFTGRSVGYAVASGVLGALVLGSISFAAGEAGLARALSLVIATQLLAGLVLDSIGLFGAGADFSVLKAAGVVLIVIGGVLVVRY